MTTTTAAGARPAARRSSARLPLPLVARRIALVTHIGAAGTWIGIDVLVAVLVGTARLTADERLAGLAYRALGTFVVTPMAASAILCLVSGLLLGLGTTYGLLRYWWVLVKLVLTCVLLVLIMVALRPGMGEVAATGLALERGVPAGPEVDFLVFPPAVSLVTLTFAVVLSVFKPWGRTRSARGQRTRTGQ